MGAKPGDCVQKQEPPIASMVGIVTHAGHCLPQEQEMLEKCYTKLL